MAESGDSVSIDMETIPFGGEECVVETSRGPVSVFVCGDQEKPAMITYPDVALNCVFLVLLSFVLLCIGLFFCPDADSLLLQNFCIYHINAPGHELGAAAIPSYVPSLSVDDLADQLAEVLDFFGNSQWSFLSSHMNNPSIKHDAILPLLRNLGYECVRTIWNVDFFLVKKAMCLGALAGAYILTLFAMKYKERAVGLILVSPLCRAPSWTEWFYNKVMLSCLYFYGMCGMLKEFLLVRYFSELLDDRQSSNVIRYLRAINRRHDLTDGLKDLECNTLIFVGETSPFYSEALHMDEMMDRRCTDLVEIQACGSLVTEEQPDSMLVPLELFLKGLGFYRQPPTSRTSQHAACPSPSPTICIPQELLSPEGLGIKLKPIKTRVPIEA
ncbi:hypothetical protein Taro_044529 [Colocasia esculenta]|uniref:Pollen-specific protein SF21 n=1 Tax=Colocasia esculenta TaxID=4460 RepID=A0A843WNX5_COLES|nr:hypothetical protein [Colocasia esculenta]